MELFATVSEDEAAKTDDEAVDADVVLGIVGLLLLEFVGLEVSGLDEGPGAAPTFGAGIF